MVYFSSRNWTLFQLLYTRIKVYVGDDAEIFAVIFDNSNKVILNKKDANSIDIPLINILPQISPLLQEEKIIKFQTVQSNLLTRLSSRNFRNQLNYYYSDYEKFRDLAENTWKGLGIHKLDNQNGFAGEPLSLFVRDNNFPAEIGWMGHGLQMWLQTIWFLARASENSTVILDEPDVYMHADLQRKLIRLIKKRYKQVIVATHSVEIMSEVEAENILPIDSRKEKQSYANKAPIVQGIIDNIGSVHNLEIARLFSNKKFFIVEGDSEDVKLLGIFQNIIYPTSDEPFDIIPKTYVEGWSGWQRVIGTFNVLKNPNLDITVYCIFDSDYHLEQEKDERLSEAYRLNLNLHIWSKKEIENYLLNENVIARFISNKRRKGDVLSSMIVASKLREIAESMKFELYNHYATEIQNRNKQLALISCANQAKEFIDKIWESRYLDLICGKKVISTLSDWSKTEYGVSINKFSLAREFKKEEISQELFNMIQTIENRTKIERKTD